MKSRIAAVMAQVWSREKNARHKLINSVACFVAVFG